MILLKDASPQPEPLGHATHRYNMPAARPQQTRPPDAAARRTRPAQARPGKEPTRKKRVARAPADEDEDRPLVHEGSGRSAAAATKKSSRRSQRPPARKAAAPASRRKPRSDSASCGCAGVLRACVAVGVLFVVAGLLVPWDDVPTITADLSLIHI